MEKFLQEVEYTSLNGDRITLTERIISETPLSIRVNEKHLTMAMITAKMEKEFVVGYLLGQGLIRNVNDIELLEIRGYEAEVRLKVNRNAPDKKTMVDSDLLVRKEDIFECVRAILSSEIFGETEAVHSAGLFHNGYDVVCIAEDLGRHNALDKVIGYGLLNGINFGDTLAASTGRQPSEMIIKLINAGIPIIATKGVPTTMAVELAGKAGISIVGMVRGTTMKVYSTPARII
jgi:FdhD protein